MMCLRLFNGPHREDRNLFVMWRRHGCEVSRRERGRRCIVSCFHVAMVADVSASLSLASIGRCSGDPSAQTFVVSHQQCHSCVEEATVLARHRLGPVQLLSVQFFSPATSECGFPFRRRTVRGLLVLCATLLHIFLKVVQPSSGRFRQRAAH